MASDVSDALRRQVADRAYHVCEYCLIHEDDTFWGCQIDHIISRKHGGPTESANLAWACASARWTRDTRANRSNCKHWSRARPSAAWNWQCEQRHMKKRRMKPHVSLSRTPF